MKQKSGWNWVGAIIRDVTDRSSTDTFSETIQRVSEFDFSILFNISARHRLLIQLDQAFECILVGFHPAGWSAGTVFAGQRRVGPVVARLTAYLEVPGLNPILDNHISLYSS